MNDSFFFRNFPVYKTVEMSHEEDINKITESMVEDYILLAKEHKFSYRILIPRNEKNNSYAKKIGLNIQLYFLGELRKRKIKVILRDIKYIHDPQHYGWLLLNSEIYEKHLNSE